MSLAIIYAFIKKWTNQITELNKKNIQTMCFEKNIQTKENSIESKYLNATLRTIDVFDSYFDNGKQTKELKDHGSFQYVSYNGRKFLDLLQKTLQTISIINETQNTKFIDVGCGIGTKVFLASGMFSEAHGIELDENYISVGLNIMKHSSVKFTDNILLMKKDALEFTNYVDYNVIYLYRPFHDDKKQNKLENKIASEAKENSVIISPLCNFYNLNEEIRPKMIFNNGYIKTEDQKLVDEIKMKL